MKKGRIADTIIIKVGGGILAIPRTKGKNPASSEDSRSFAADRSSPCSCSSTREKGRLSPLGPEKMTRKEMHRVLHSGDELREFKDTGCQSLRRPH